MKSVEKLDPHPSTSTVQGEIEAAMLNRLGEEHRDWRRVEWVLVTKELGLAAVWQKAKPDRVWKMGSDFQVAECYARIGKLSSGHRRKLAMDALKLVALNQASSGVCGLLVVPRELHEQLKGGGWFIEALKLVKIVSVDLSDDERATLRAVTELQGKGQSRAATPKKRAVV